MERWKEWDETKIAVRQQIIDGVNATYRKLSREEFAREFVKICEQEVHDELPLVVWYQTKPSRDVTEGRRKSLDELQKEVNQFIEKWHESHTKPLRRTGIVAMIWSYKTSSLPPFGAAQATRRGGRRSGKLVSLACMAVQGAAQQDKQAEGDWMYCGKEKPLERLLNGF